MLGPPLTRSRERARSFAMMAAKYSLVSSSSRREAAPASTLHSPSNAAKILMAGACALLVFTACGINFSYGVYQEHYDTLSGPFANANAGQISVVGTLASSIMMIGAPVVDRLVRWHGTPAAVMLSGALFVASGLAASSGTQIWHFQLAQGLLQGCAASLAYIPAVVVAPRLFPAHRGLATGVVTSGTGLGGAIWAPLLRHALTRLGYRTTLVFAGLLAGVLIMSASTALLDIDTLLLGLEERRVMEEWSPQSSEEQPNPRILLAHVMASSFQSAAYFTPIYFMSSLARSLGFSETSGANIIALCNLCNCAGKVIVGHAADGVGRLKLLSLSTTASALATIGIAAAIALPLPVTAHRIALLLYAMVYGASAGAYVALLPTALIDQFGVGGFAKINGTLYMYRGIGSLAGTFVAGLLVFAPGDVERHLPLDFAGALVFAAACLCIAVFFLLQIRRMCGSERV